MMNYNKILALFIALFCFSNCNAENNSAPSKTIDAPNPILSDVFQSAIDSLIQREVDTNFIKKYINSDRLVFSDRYIKINVTGYLNKADYSYVTNQNSINKSKEFLKKNQLTLIATENKFGVPKEIITAIL